MGKRGRKGERKREQADRDSNLGRIRKRETGRREIGKRAIEKGKREKDEGIERENRRDRKIEKWEGTESNKK